MTFFQRLATPLAIVGAFALTGCLKSNQTYTIYPDGSGKAEIRMSFLGMFGQMAKSGGQMGEQEGPRPDPFDQVRKTMDGKVYWSNLHTEDGDDGSWTIAGTAYFEDVNQLKPKQGNISFKKNEDGGNTFEMVTESDEMKQLAGGDDSKKTPEQKQQEEATRAMCRARSRASR